VYVVYKSFAFKFIGGIGVKRKKEFHIFYNAIPFIIFFKNGRLEKQKREGSFAMLIAMFLSISLIISFAAIV
jgi:hypothetical protein